MKRRILATLMALAMCLTLLPTMALAANTVTIKSVTYRNNSDGTASATINFSWTGGSITYIDPMIGRSKGSYEFDLDTRDALNLPAGWSLTKNNDGTWTLVANPLSLTGGIGKPEEGTEVWVGVDVTGENDNNSDQLKVTVPAEGRQVTVQRPAAGTHTVTVSYTGLPTGQGYKHQDTATCADGATYRIVPPVYDAYVPTTAVVTGTVNGADVHVTVNYVANSFKVKIKCVLGDGVKDAADPATGEHYATGYGTLKDFEFYHADVQDYVFVEKITGLKLGDSYSWTPTAYTGLRPNPAVVSGKIETPADVERTVTYVLTCTDGRAHAPSVTHEGLYHKVTCSKCGIELQLPRTDVQYESAGEGTNQHSMTCMVDHCLHKFGTEDCAGPNDQGSVCGGECSKCHGRFNYDDHKYGGWEQGDPGKHVRICERCGYHDEQTCNHDKWDHQSSYPNGQHRHICSVCSYTDEQWTNCAYVAQKTITGFHRMLCECGAGSTAQRCTYELTTTATEHVYACSQHCGNSCSGGHYKRSPVRENYKASTVTDFGGYDLVTYCGRCGYEMSRTSKSIPPRPWPEEKNKNKNLKDHFNSSGGRAIRPGRGNSSGGGGNAGAGGGAAAPAPGRGSGGRMLENEWIDAVNAHVITDGIAEYMDENYATLLLAADDALNAYYEANPTHLGEGWSVDLEPDVVLNVTAYDEATRTLTLNITATYGVYVTNTETQESTLIGEGYPLTVNFPVDMSFAVPAGIAADGASLYVRHNHNGAYYYYTATVTAEGDAVPTATFTTTNGFSTFELRPTAWQKPSTGGGGSGGGGSSATTTTTTTPAATTTTTGADGSKTEATTTTTTTKNADGSTTEKTTETATTTATDGTKTESKSETAVTTKKNADGSTTEATKATETATTTAADGSKTTVEKTAEAETTVKATGDGGKTTTEKATETATTTAADGTKTTVETKTESVETLDKSGNGTVESTKTETVKDASGKVTETTVTESKGTVETAADGTKTTTTTNTATTTDAEGNVSVTVTTEAKGETPDGTTGTVVTDESGELLSAEANVSEAAVEAAKESGEPIPVPMTVAPANAENAEQAASVRIEMPAVKSGSDDGGASAAVAKMPRVEIAVPKRGPGIVAMIRNALGKLIPVKECYEGSVILPVDGSCEVVIVDNTKTFADVGANDWFRDNVTFVTAREIFNGTGDGKFDPNASMTRGMLAQVLYNFDRNAAPNGSYAFADATGKWFADAASWAASAGVVTGTDKGFEGEVNVTRETVATMLYRYAKAQGYDVSASGNLSAYADAASVSGWAADAMRWAVGAGLINGVDGSLAPQAPATRAQLAAIMERFVENAVR